MKQYLLIPLVLIATALLEAQEISVLGEGAVIGIEERLSESIPPGIVLKSGNGDTVQFGSLFNKPTVLALVYYRCPGVCTPLMDGLAAVVKKSDLLIGKDYQIATVSFNPREGYELAARKKENYINALALEGVEEGWQFYASDSASIYRLTESVGFRYQKAGNDYTHTATLVFISPEGKITRYLNGTQFLPFEFKMAVLEASAGIPGPTINKVLQYCYSYDPEGQRYVLSITRVAGIIISFILLLLFITLVFRSVFRKKTDK